MKYNIDALTNSALKKMIHQLLTSQDGDEESILEKLSRSSRPSPPKNDLADLHEEMHGSPNTPMVEDDDEDNLGPNHDQGPSDFDDDNGVKTARVANPGGRTPPRRGPQDEDVIGPNRVRRSFGGDEDVQRSRGLLRGGKDQDLPSRQPRSISRKNDEDTPRGRRG